MRGHSAVALANRYILLLGGYATAPNGSVLRSSVLVYDTHSDSYFYSTPEMPLQVMSAGAQLIGSTLFLAGGEDAARHRSAGMAIGIVGRTY